ncbi:AlpA family phage regulatory protein [Hyphomicrobium sp. CS1BSMeth3]|uniref:helix-turn-helix transcriptional regulator n=1 Tax=Hyphomicrobium sp. CS1BSMeth3 TaxID=1892844 RepID=UPI000930351D|nr:AlpA family phage regulatory protein [Hyphomicrobium sp. CS1BSMeth3]
MSADTDGGSLAATIARARVKADQMAAEYADHMSQPDFSMLSPRELISMAEGSRRLTSAEVAALDEAWFRMFGERITEDSNARRTEEPPKPALPPPNFMLSPKLAAEVMGVSLSYLKRAEKSGKLPKRVRLGGRRVAYFSKDIAEWQERIAETARGSRRPH